MNVNIEDKGQFVRDLEEYKRCKADHERARQQVSRGVRVPNEVVAELQHQLIISASVIADYVVNSVDTQTGKEIDPYHLERLQIMIRLSIDVKNAGFDVDNESVEGYLKEFAKVSGLT